MTWNEAQAWEAAWHGSCTNSYGEQEKQHVYARKMGMRMHRNGKSPYNIDMQGKSVIDIGGGPASLLLKCTNLAYGKVVDPLPVPEWVKARYELAGIDLVQKPAEEIDDVGFDLALIYNCLQHTISPETIIKNALHAAKEIRIFEWIDTPGLNAGHPHSLTAKELDSWLGGEGRVEHLKESWWGGKCYYGVFLA